MSKFLISLILVLSVASGRSGNTPSEECFMDHCRSSFLIMVADMEQCGSDGNPYHNVNAIECADECAKKFGSRVRGISGGQCPDKPQARKYWHMKGMNFTL
ncbi:hypothetical protein WA026_023036 [Henosepilachna vigintioctopunctata]|uniref:Uncharacterized protein n=1 Tax=Henosepilachna vigintioctopunctata TaxID=420089 RepID=A0AAW1VJM3_9CUCU